MRGITQCGEGVGLCFYIGQPYDDATQLSYLQMRYYSGGNAKFISQDPMFTGDPNQQNLINPQNLNSYSYADNNPINKSDSTGRTADPTDLFDLASFVTDWIGVGIGYTVGNQQMVADNKEAAKWDAIGMVSPASGLGDNRDSHD